MAIVALQGAATAAPAGSQTFRSGTHLVEVTIVVRDRAGRAVTDLAASDFQIFEDGKEQRASLFALQSEGDGRHPGTPAANVFTNRAGGESAGVTVILFDRLNTDWVDQAQARRHVVRYLAKTRPADRIGLYVLEPSAIRVVHDFTTDIAALRRAAERIDARESREVSIGNEARPRIAASGDPRLGAMEAQLEADLDRLDAKLKGDTIKGRVDSTLSALEAIARHLAGIPGRKNLIWVSSAFPLDFNDGFGRRTVSTEVSLATRAMTDADVAIYPVDARGLLPGFARGSATKPEYQTLRANMPPIDSMRMIAERTGGTAYFNSNDLSGAIAKAVDDSRVTYLLGYYPENTRWDGHFREISIKVKRRDLDVRHRTGYLALPPPPQTAASRQNALVRALRSPLNATGVPMTVTTAEPAADEMQLAIRIDASAVELLQSPDGLWVGSLDIAIAHVLEDGSLPRALDVTVPLRWSSAMRDQALREGVVLNHAVRRNPSAHELRIAVRDSATGAMGSVTIPER